MSQITNFSDGGGSAGGILTITGNSGGAVSPDGAGNLTISGDSFLLVEGTPGTHSMELTISEQAEYTAIRSWNGTFLDDVRGVVSSDGTTVIISIDKAGGGDLKVNFTDGFYEWDTTPAATTTLTHGSDISPTLNRVYLDQATKTLSVSTGDWPSTEHARIGEVLIPSATLVQADGAYMLHGMADEAYSVSKASGHIAHIGSWIRHQHATWLSGVVPTLTITTNVGTNDNVIFTSTSGNVLQMHEHVFPAFTGTPDYYVSNDSVTAYKQITDINEITLDSDGDSMVGKYFTIVVWGVSSGNGTSEKLFINLPSGSYNSLANASNDVDKVVNYSIPADLKGSAFLIASYIFKQTAVSGGTWTQENHSDLRGLYPSLTAGGSTSATTEFADNAFKIFDESDIAKVLDFQVSGVTTGNTRTITMCDADLDLTSPSFGGTVTTAGNFALPATTATDGQITINSVAALQMYGTNNFFAGGAGNLTLTGADNVGIGSAALDSNTNGYSNVNIGTNSGTANITGWKNIYIGHDSGATSEDCIGNTAVGHETMKSLATGVAAQQNVAIGLYSMKNSTGGIANVAICTYALNSCNSNSKNNIAIGSTSQTAVTSGGYNVSVGTGSLDTITTGLYNCSIGEDSGSSLTTSDSDNVCIMHNGISGDNNTIRVGTQGTGDGQQDTTFIAGIYNTTPAGGNDGAVIIDSNGQLGSTTNIVGYTSFNAQTGTAYTAVIGDVNKVITMSNASANVLTVPLNSSVAFPVGTMIGVIMKNVGQTSIAGSAGVTINSEGSKLKVDGRYASALLTKEATDTWYLTGQIKT